MYLVNYSIILITSIFLSYADFTSASELSIIKENDLQALHTKHKEFIEKDNDTTRSAREEKVKSSATDAIKISVLKGRINILIGHINSTISMAGHAADMFRRQLELITSSFFNKTESDLNALKGSAVAAATDIKSAKGHIIGANKGILECIIAELKSVDQLLEEGKRDIFSCVRSTLAEVLADLAHLDSLVIDAKVAVNVAIGNMLTCAAIVDKDALCVCLDTVLIELENSSYTLASQVVSTVLNTGILLVRLPGQLVECAGSVIIVLTVSIGKIITTLLSCVSLI